MIADAVLKINAAISFGSVCHKCFNSQLPIHPRYRYNNSATPATFPPASPPSPSPPITYLTCHPVSLTERPRCSTFLGQSTSPPRIGPTACLAAHPIGSTASAGSTCLATSAPKLPPGSEGHRGSLPARLVLPPDLRVPHVKLLSRILSLHTLTS